MALFHTGLGRDGPGILLRDIRRDEADVLIARDAIVSLRPDILLLLDIDWDLNDTTLLALMSSLSDAGHPMPHHFAPRPNSGMATGLDLDGDGRLGTADDAQGWARFAGSGGMALLSRWPIDTENLVDHTSFLWRDLPDARLPQRNGQIFPSEAVYAIQRLASTAAWEVPVQVRGHPLTLMAYHAGPPAFGGSENRNFNRNADETAFWRYRLDGLLGPPPATPFVLLADANLDPVGGDGDHAEIQALLAHPALQDPQPVGQFPADGTQRRDTAFWRDGPGALRVEYALPSATLRVLDTGLIWPSNDARHAIVWLDIAWPPEQR